MSWIFEAYANVYGAALFGGEASRGNAASAKAKGDPRFSFPQLVFRQCGRAFDRRGTASDLT